MPDEEDRHVQLVEVKIDNSSVDFDDHSSPCPGMNRLVSNGSELSSVGSKDYLRAAMKKGQKRHTMHSYNTFFCCIFDVQLAAVP